MASLTIQRTAVCDGGNHHTMRVTMGGVSVEETMTSDQFTGPVTTDDRIAFMKVATRLKKIGDSLTNGQLLAAAIAGITVTL